MKIMELRGACLPRGIGTLCSVASRLILRGAVADELRGLGDGQGLDGVEGAASACCRHVAAYSRGLPGRRSPNMSWTSLRRSSMCWAVSSHCAFRAASTNCRCSITRGCAPASTTRCGSPNEGAWPTNILRLPLLGHPAPKHTETPTGDGVLVRLLNGESLDALRADAALMDAIRATKPNPTPEP